MKKNIRKNKNFKDNNEEIELDLSKVKDGYKKVVNNDYVKKYAYLILLIIPIILAAHFRLYPSDLPITEDWARNSIESSIKSNIASQINQQYPNLPTSNKNNMINENYATFLESNKADIESAVVENAKMFRDQFKDEDGNTYLLAIDPYYYYRQVENMIETGHAYDDIIEGVPTDTHMYAPIGKKMSNNLKGASFHVWLSTFWHKFLNLFTDISVMGSFFYMPVIISALSVIPAFFIARRAGGNLAGFFAGMIVGLHSVFLGRTPAGFSDTDAYNVLFPLMISWLFIEAFENKDLKKKLTLASLAGLTAGIYSFAWSAWWYIFDIILISMIGYVIYYGILHRDELKKGFKNYISQENVKNPLMILGTFFVSTSIMATIFGRNLFFVAKATLAPINSLAIQDSAKADLWPNVFTTVAELNTASLNSIINGLGGKFMFIIALMGMIMTISSTKNKKNLGFLGGSFGWLLLLLSFSAKLSVTQFIILLGIPVALILSYYLLYKETNIDIKYAVFFTIWFLGTVYTTTKGIRFLLLMVPVFGVAYGIAIGKFYRYIIDWVDEELDLNKKIGSILIGGLLLLLLIAPIKDANATALNEVPSMNDGWFQSLDKINQEAAPDAIINSWWDFGHWFKAIGDRAVTFDGASQNTPMAHWIGRSLLTSNEEESIGILNMLDCGSNNAFEKLQEYGFSTIESVDILREITKSDEDDAKDIFEDNGLSGSQINEMIALTKCDAPENYYITSEDMIGKSGVWAHFGSWDFRRALIWNEYRNLPRSEFDSKLKELGFNDTEISDIYYGIQPLSEGRSANTWIAPWPSYASGLSSCQETTELIVCQSGLIINKSDNMSAYIPTQDGNLHPKRFSYVDNETFVMDEYEKGKVLTGSDGSFIGASLIKQGNNYYSILMHYELVGSTFNKLFYYDGAGLDHFEKFSDVRDVTGARIIVWKVNWEK
ncbi:hypothetical protein C0585_07470 [Candidatus Woesearchaeota archaeon]|nr:MAG: hypothetical protein C0585_07470 [Candidatus Woesearchaeota archaeon]